MRQAHALPSLTTGLPPAPGARCRPSTPCASWWRRHATARPRWRPAPRPAAGQPERPFGEQPLFTGHCRRVALRPGPAPRCRARPAAGCAPVGDRAGAALVGAASPVATANAQREITPVWDDLHNPRASVVVRIGMGRKASFAANSPAIGKKSNAVDRPRPRCHRPQGVMQVIPCATRGLHAHLTNFIVASPGATTLPSHSPWRSP